MWMYFYSKREHHPLGKACIIAQRIASEEYRKKTMYLYSDNESRRKVMDQMVELKLKGKDFDEAAKEVLAYWVGRRLKG